MLQLFSILCVVKNSCISFLSQLLHQFMYTLLRSRVKSRVGSSKNNTFGECKIALAKANRWRTPFERTLATSNTSLIESALYLCGYTAYVLIHSTMMVIIRPLCRLSIIRHKQDFSRCFETKRTDNLWKLPQIISSKS